MFSTNGTLNLDIITLHSSQGWLCTLLQNGVGLSPGGTDSAWSPAVILEGGGGPN